MGVKRCRAKRGNRRGNTRSFGQSWAVNAEMEVPLQRRASTWRTAVGSMRRHWRSSTHRRHYVAAKAVILKQWCLSIHPCPWEASACNGWKGFVFVGFNISHLRILRMCFFMSADLSVNWSTNLPCMGIFKLVMADTSLRMLFKYWKR